MGNGLRHAGLIAAIALLGSAPALAITSVGSGPRARAASIDIGPARTVIDTGSDAPEEPGMHRREPSIHKHHKSTISKWNRWFRRCSKGNERACFREPSPVPRGDIAIPRVD